MYPNPKLRGYYHELSRGYFGGVPWYVGHNDTGHRCGYACVKKGHPWFGVPYEDIEDDVEVHGGLTYSDKGPPRKVRKFSYQWWLGFDCAHSWDGADPELMSPALLDALAHVEGITGHPSALFTFGPIRTTEYVEEQCIALCKQILAAEDPERVKRMTNFEP